jgi:hypothetical protein
VRSLARLVTPRRASTAGNALTWVAVDRSRMCAHPAPAYPDARRPGHRGDEVFEQLVLARIIEPTSKLDSERVLSEVGVAGPSYRTPAAAPAALCQAGLAPAAPRGVRGARRACRHRVKTHPGAAWRILALPA